MGSTADLLEAIERVSQREALLISTARSGGGSVPANPEKIAALIDAIHALDRAQFPFALVGGVAVGIHSGAVRATVDVDLAVPSITDRQRAATSLVGAGFRHTGSFTHSVKFRHASGEPVQLVLDPAFDVMIDRVETRDYHGTSVRIVRREDLIAMKERAAVDPARRRSKALQDQADLALLRGDFPDLDEGW
jgi:hypothetical protein